MLGGKDTKKAASGCTTNRQQKRGGTKLYNCGGTQAARRSETVVRKSVTLAGMSASDGPTKN